MYLLYVDESGKSALADPQQPHFVYSGVLIRDDYWPDVAKDFEVLIKNYCSATSEISEFEFHAVDLEHKKGPFKNLNLQERDTICSKILSVVPKNRLKLFGIAIDKSKFTPRNDSPFEVAFKFLLERLEQYFQRYERRYGIKNRAIIIMDEQKGREENLRESLKKYRLIGTPHIRPDHLIETVFFLPSFCSPGLQLADFVAYHFAKHLKMEARGLQWDKFRLIEPCFDRTGGKTVGLKVWP